MNLTREPQVKSTNSSPTKVEGGEFRIVDNRPEAFAQKRFVDNRPEGITQRKLKGIVESVPQKIIPGNGLIQRVVVNVGFDGTPTQSMFAGPGNILQTAGVANCIAVVVWDTGGQGAVMRHYDTINAYVRSQRDPHTGQNASVFNQAALANLRQAMITELDNNIVPTGYNFAISLGGIWADVNPDSAHWQSRMNLLMAIQGAFGIEPSRAGSTASFDTTTNVLGA